MDTIINELLNHTMSNISTGRLNTNNQYSAFEEPVRPNRREEQEPDDLRSFIRPTDTFEQNIQLLNIIQTIETERHSYDVKRRQLRIVSDLMEDYQYNIQSFLQILSITTQNDFTQSRHSNRRPTPANTTRHGYEVPPRTNRANTANRHTFEFHRTSAGLTDRQVELATRTLVYDASLNNEPRCPISLEDFTAGEEIVQIIGCDHYFKCGALREWFRRNTQCPVCRYSVTTPSGRVRNVIPNGNAAPIRGNVDLGNTRTTADAWTTILAGLLTSPENTRLYTIEQDIVFNNPEEVD